MTLKIYNTLAGQIEEFRPRNEGRVDMFVCGPTVYDYSHIGHARTYVFFDVVAKYLKTIGYDIKYVQNITNIDDKIIARAQEQDISPQILAEKYEKEYLADMESLGIDSVWKYARATDHIPDIIKQIETLISNGCAYAAPAVPARGQEAIVDGNRDVYFSVEKFADYGKLSGQKLDELQEGVRIELESNKNNPRDFVLWKAQNYRYEPAWHSPWGNGRPGWHIEDTAITEHYLGQQYDLHGGGQELIFPHHEAEIAQQESASGKKPFVKYWMHAGWLMVNGEKMSKSLGNYITIRDALNSYSPQALRLMFLSNYYRSPLNYTSDSIKQFSAGAVRISEFSKKIQRINTDEGIYEADSDIKETWQKILNAMNNDFNTPEAIAAIFDYIRLVNGRMNQIPKAETKKIKKFLEELDGIFGIVPTGEHAVPDNVSKLVDLREEARENRDWALSDSLRSQIFELGYAVEDTPNGPYVTKRPD